MPTTHTQQEIIQLITIFFVWKIFLLLVALTSPGPGYDTSTTLLGESSSVLASRLVRWDSIYYTKVAQRYYVFEQEWAFGWGYTQALSSLSSFSSLLIHGFPISQAWAGIVLSHASHLISVIALYDTTKVLFNRMRGFPDLACTAAVLHIISPAGLFLSSPCAESFYSCLSFLAHNLYVRSKFSRDDSPRKDILQLAAAVFFGISATVRGNGLLNGLIFAKDAFHGCSNLLQHGLSAQRIRSLIVTAACGSVVGFGYIIPQYIAYYEYCSSGELRPWCSATVPSIYNFVQGHYWNTGLLKYWTFSNSPLFVIGGPCIALLIGSASWAWTFGKHVNKALKAQERDITILKTTMRTLALPQFTLIGMLLAAYHIQIVNRLSSGYPLWYWWLARTLHKPNTVRERNIATAAVVWMISYASIQGALFASFLPPA